MDINKNIRIYNYEIVPKYIFRKYADRCLQTGGSKSFEYLPNNACRIKTKSLTQIVYAVKMDDYFNIIDFKTGKKLDMIKAIY